MSNQLLPFENIKKIILDLKIEKLLLETFKQIKKSKDITTGDITTEDIVYSLNIIKKNTRNIKHNSNFRTRRYYKF